jgi:hypothetical protein
MEESLMAKTVVKLFKELQQAEKAVADLKAAGYKAEEIGILTANKSGAEKLAGGATIAADLSLPDSGPVCAIGPMATVLKEVTIAKGDGEAALAATLSIPEETIKYYEFGVAMGGVLVSVHTGEGRSLKAQEILRSAGVETMEKGARWSKSPGFAAASRMTQTNPIDAPMSGDFRRY